MPEKPSQRRLDRVLAEILHERAAFHISAGRHARALPLLKTLVMEFPAYRKAKADLINFYRELARQAQNKGDRPRAEAYLAEARKLAKDKAMPSVPAAEEEPPAIKEEGENLLRLARCFIDRHYPDQARWLAMAWRIFHGVDPEALGETALADALGAAGGAEMGRIAAQVSILLGVAARGAGRGVAPKSVEEQLRKAGERIGAEKSLINQLVDLVHQQTARLRQWPR